MEASITSRDRINTLIESITDTLRRPGSIKQDSSALAASFRGAFALPPPRGSAPVHVRFLLSVGALALGAHRRSRLLHHLQVIVFILGSFCSRGACCAYTAPLHVCAFPAARRELIMFHPDPAQAQALI